ncbi:MAG: hypothetical protein HS113_14230 [Verrucomicrobiales bacterium]|nr:hypothetical protein [Verrucomicrobiales bacterium]
MNLTKLLQDIGAGVAAGVGAAAIWAILVLVYNAIRALQVWGAIRSQLSAVNETSEQFVKSQDSQSCDWEVGYIIKNSTKIDLVVRSVFLEFEANGYGPRRDLQLVYRGTLKPEYLNFILLKPEVEGTWLAPLHRFRYREVASATVTVEYRSPFGTTTWRKVTASERGLGNLRWHLISFYQRKNPWALPPELRAEKIEPSDAPPSSTYVIPAIQAALQLKKKLGLDRPLRGAPDVPFSEGDRAWTLWVEQLTRMLSDKNSPHYRELAGLMAHQRVFLATEFPEAVLDFLYRVCEQLGQSTSVPGPLSSRSPV